jgi:hypothetical protein
MQSVRRRLHSRHGQGSTKVAARLKHWEVYHLGRSGKRIGTVQAADENQALQRAVVQFEIKPRDLPYPCAPVGLLNIS